MTLPYRFGGIHENSDDLPQVRELVTKTLYANGRIGHDDYRACEESGELSYVGNQIALNMGKRIVYMPMDLSCSLMAEIEAEFPSVHRKLRYGAQ
ncbi:MAG: hypothetical protein J4431_02115 [Candidatus Aenigmarchaeota archaeon]|nr:hypothetical protein [Candidatus Aenigmarchaeota archaeon]